MAADVNSYDARFRAQLQAAQALIDAKRQGQSKPWRSARSDPVTLKSQRCRNGAVGESSTFRLFVMMMWSAVALDAPAARLRGRMFPCASIPKNRRATT